MKTALNDLKVLIVEDQDDAREVMQEMLKEIGITQIFEAKDGHEALESISKSSDFINVVLCDWNMPSMTGLELLQQVRERDASLPFLMVTGRSDMDSVMEARDEGVSAYVRKPYTAKQLEAKLRIILHKMAA